MRRTRRRWFAVAVIVIAIGLLAAVIGTGQRTTTASDPPAVAETNSVTVTVPAPTGTAAGPVSAADKPSSTAADGPVPGFGVPYLPEDGRDYSVDPTMTDTGLEQAGADGAPWPAPPVDPTAAVASAVAAAEAVGVHQAVVVIDRANGAVLTQTDSDQQFPALSLLKLMIAADVINGSDSGSTPDQVTLNWLEEMIARSDDVTAGDFYAQAGADAMVDRVIQRYGLTGSAPTPDGEYWGNVQTTATDMAALLGQVLADPVTSPVIGPAMQAATAIAQDGVDQRFGMRTVPGAGSKQGWGCCLSGVTGIHSMGFTPERIVVVLSSAEPGDYSLGEQDGLALQADPAAQVSIATVTNTVRAALGMPVADDLGPSVPVADPGVESTSEEAPPEQDDELPLPAGGY